MVTFSERKGIVVAERSEIAEAAAEILKSRGNAIDAICGAIILGLCAKMEHFSFGSGGMVIVLGPGTGAGICDFLCTMPGKGLPRYVIKRREVKRHNKFWQGRGTSAVPGLAGGIKTFHGRWGRLPFSKIREKIFSLLKKKDIDQDEKMIKLLIRLEQEGPGFFYHGDIAEMLVNNFGPKNYGIITYQDLASYRPLFRELSLYETQGFTIYLPCPQADKSLLSILPLLNDLTPSDLGTPKHFYTLKQAFAKLDFPSSIIPLGTTINVIDNYHIAASGIFSSGTGCGYDFLYPNTQMNNFVQKFTKPGERIEIGPLSCFISKERLPRFVLSSQDGKNTWALLFEVLLNLLRLKMDIKKAINIGRICFHQSNIEAEYNAPIIPYLSQLSTKKTIYNNLNSSVFGIANAAVWDPVLEKYQGISDKRSCGSIITL
jgi:gamma-glutamyltranspeptidase